MITTEDGHPKLYKKIDLIDLEIGDHVYARNTYYIVKSISEDGLQIVVDKDRDMIEQQRTWKIG